MSHLSGLLVLGFTLTAAAVPTDAGAQLSSTFDAGAEGWLITAEDPGTWHPAGGNPDGCVIIIDSASGERSYALAPYRFLGDWSAMTSADTLRYDVHLVNTSGGATSLGSYTFRLSGPGGTAIALISTPPAPDAWTTLKIPIHASRWTVQAGTWNGLLASVTSLRLSVEFINGTETVRLDNVHLSRTPGPLHLACVFDTFNDNSSGDWIFLGGAAVVTGLGNGDECISQRDADGMGSALAPARFLGDWSDLDGNGFITVDLRHSVGSGTRILPAPVVILSGPGGYAMHTVDAADFPPVGRVWKTYSIPLEASSWTVHSGSWTGLLADVAECRLPLQFYQDPETILFDNFGRVTTACLPLDDAVVSLTAEETVEGYLSFAEISVAAFNPVDGRLYGLVRRSDFNGGGLFCLEAPNPSLRLAGYDAPAALLFDHDGDAFISEDYSGIVYRYASVGITAPWVEGFHEGDADPYGMAPAPPGFAGPNVAPGDLLVTDRGSGGPDGIYAFSPDLPDTGRLVMPDTGNTDFLDLAADPLRGKVYTCDFLISNAVYELHPDGTLDAIPISPPVAGMQAIVSDWLTDRLYVIKDGGAEVHRIDLATGATTRVLDGFLNLNPCALEIDVSGRRLWVADVLYNRVYEVALSPVTAVPEPDAVPRLLPPRVFPNPSRASVRLSFTAREGEVALVQIVDIRGRIVRTLLAGPAGEGERGLLWDARDSGGRPVAAGVYLVRVLSGGQEASSRIIRLP